MKSISRFIHRWKVVASFLVIFDAAAVAFSWFFGLWVRYDFVYSAISDEYLRSYGRFLPVYLLVVVVIFWQMRMYRSIWRFVGANEMLRFTATSIATAIMHGVCITVIFGRMPFAYYLIGGAVQTALVVGIRFSYRFFLAISRTKGAEGSRQQKRVMIIGAGVAGTVTIRELQQTDKIKTQPVCVIDDNSNKWGRFIYGVPVVGGRESIIDSARQYQVEEIYLCIPSASAQVRKEILNICKETGCVMKSLPGIYQLINDEVMVSNLRNVEIEDLLGREPIQVNMDEIFQQIKGKSILVTGGGGSIGSELCRQIAAHEPKKLVIFDIYENTTYGVELELREKFPELDLSVLIGSVRDSRRLDQIFSAYRPEIVYHAAAHKHVPLMEYSPNEAIKNNVIGTYKTAYAALKHGTKRFVLISTDKAVNPTNIMGASKRLCEMVIQSMDAISKSREYGLLPQLHAHMGRDEEILTGGTQYVAVRFGNVLGSNGSVLHRFKKQIERSEPVTVTHPDIIRYFMTIPEAVSLVLQAGCYAKGGEIFVLDMGEPVKIDTLARNLIQLSGLTPDVDIPVIYTGLRPGEKLYEEKLMAEEGILKTANQMIFIGKPIPFRIEDFFSGMKRLRDASYDNSDGIVAVVESLVSTFHPAGEHPDGGKPSKKDCA